MGNNKDKDKENNKALKDEELANVTGAGPEVPTDMHPGYSLTRDYGGGLSGATTAPGYGVPEYVKKN